MGMDGLSFSNTNAVRDKTSAELANKTEQAIQADPTNIPKQVHDISTNRRVREKDENEESEKQKKGDLQKDDEEEIFEDGLVEEDTDEPEEIAIEDIENPNKDFYVKLNVKDDIIELYDSTTDKLIETISGNELGELVQKLNMASGIFVNKKV